MILKNIPIDTCVHFRGFRYGGFGNHIYEDYISGLARNTNLSELRETFKNRILAYRGNDFSSALNIELSKKYPAWSYPWSIKSIRLKYTNHTPENNPDIVSHFSSLGVLTSHINREYFWLERAYKAILHGYKPELYGYITALCLRKKHSCRYIVIDGNHRLAALNALGYESITAKVIYPTLLKYNLCRVWPGVVSRQYTTEDAISIFDRYFMENNFVLPEDDYLSLINDETLLT